MTREQVKLTAKELIEKVRKATTYQYQEYAGANYSTFEHDIATLKSVALITVQTLIDHLPKLEFMEDLNKSIKNRELLFWEQVKNELKALK